jgi:hypothetical protein
MVFSRISEKVYDILIYYKSKTSEDGVASIKGELVVCQIEQVLIF